MTYAIIIAAIVIILALVFLRKHDDSQSDYQEPQFKHSGRKWVFNGILDIDNPPQDNNVFKEYRQPMQLMVKKGYMHYSIEPVESLDEKYLGLWQAEAVIGNGGSIDIVMRDTVVASLPAGQKSLVESIRKNHTMPAYLFIAKIDDHLYGEACVRK